MASFTRRAIMEAFLKLLEERPLSKITVKDIVEECGINRNTFYYHFEDIPALVEAIVREMVDRLIRDEKTISSLEECLNVAVGFLLKYRRATLHLYQSANRDIYERYLLKMCDYVVRRLFDTAFDTSGMDRLDLEVLIQAYRCQCFGMYIEWLDGGLKDDFQPKMLRLCELRKDMLEQVVERAGGKYTGQIQ